MKNQSDISLELFLCSLLFSVSRYKGALYRIILTNGGTAVASELAGQAIQFAGGAGLAVTQAPDGSLIEARYTGSELYGYKPVEEASSAVAVKSIFPRRGGLAGGSTLTIYGQNFQKNGASPSITVGGSNCVVQSTSNKKLKCTLPGGLGTVDVVVTVGGESYTFYSGYRYISGT